MLLHEESADGGVLLEYPGLVLHADIVEFERQAMRARQGQQ